MAIKYENQNLTGTISNQSFGSSGLTHMVVAGQMLCPSGLNFGSKNLVVDVFKKNTNAKSVLKNVSCSKCHAKFESLIVKNEEQKKAGA